MSKVTMIALGLAIVVGAGVQEAQARKGPDMRINFEEIDANSDGQVTLEEMQAHRAARFSEQDTDGNGILSREELTAGAKEGMEKRMEKRLDRMIERRDANGDGGLSLEEMGSGDRAARGFSRLDANDDGAISLAEFEEAREKMRDHRKGQHGKRQ